MSLARNGRAKQAGSRGGNSARPAQAGRTADRYLQPGEKAIEPDYSSPWVKASLERTHLTPSVRPDARCTDVRIYSSRQSFSNVEFEGSESRAGRRAQGQRENSRESQTRQRPAEEEPRGFPRSLQAARRKQHEPEPPLAQRTVALALGRQQAHHTLQDPKQLRRPEGRAQLEGQQSRYSEAGRFQKHEEPQGSAAEAQSEHWDCRVAEVSGQETQTVQQRRARSLRRELGRVPAARLAGRSGRRQGFEDAEDRQGARQASPAAGRDQAVEKAGEEKTADASSRDQGRLNRRKKQANAKALNQIESHRRCESYLMCLLISSSSEGLVCLSIL